MVRTAAAAYTYGMPCHMWQVDQSHSCSSSKDAMARTRQLHEVPQRQAADVLS